MSTEISTLITQGRGDEVWRRFCGFLDLTLVEFRAIQERLLREQLRLVAGSTLGRMIMGERVPASVDEFRRQVRLTTYEDYAPYLAAKREDVLAEKPMAWAHTSGRSGQFKWVPYTGRQFKMMGESILSAVLLANARTRDDVRIRPGDVLIYNAPARPYMSGYLLYSLAELFDFRFAPALEKTEDMTFEQRIAASFKIALRTGIDTVGSISSVLIRISEQLAQSSNNLKLSGDLLHPRVLGRMGSGVLRARLEGRQLLPRDLWRPKGMLVGGTDTDVYRTRLERYWGCALHEQYGCTEGPSVMATNAWTRQGMYFLPHPCFYEFIPEEEWVRSRSNPQYIPATVMLDEVQVGQRYELVMTSFYGGPFLRYRLHDLVRFISLADPQAGIQLPAMVFEGRDSDLIDLAGFTGLIDETLVWRALEDTELPYEEWFVRKELLAQDVPGLHLYVEMKDPVADRVVGERVQAQLCMKNQFYADLTEMLDYPPLRVTQLAPGTFARYIQMQRADGSDMAHWKPRHMNAPDAVRDTILEISRDQG